MTIEGVVTKPLDLHRQLEEAYRRAVEVELEAIRATEDLVLGSAGANAETQGCERHSKWARAAEAAERAARLRKALQRCQEEEGTA